MSEGLFQLLFIGFFVLISIADAISKKRKRAETEAAEGDSQGGIQPRPEYTRSHGTTDGDDEEEAEVESWLPSKAQSSEGMVPEELWEEISQLARTEHPEGQRPAGETTPVPERQGDRSWSYDDRVERHGKTTRRAEDRVRSGDALAPGDDGGAPVRPEGEGMLAPDDQTRQIAPVPGSGGTVPRRGARHWLSDEASGAAALRRAVVIREVLGPPVALRRGGVPVDD